MKIEKITPHIAGMLIGQKAVLFWDGQLDRVGTLVEIQQENERSNGLGFYTEDMGLLFYPYKDVVFLLRRLESITEEESLGLYRGCRSDNQRIKDHHEWLIAQINSELIMFTPSAWLYLLSKGFDLFGLIDAGLAKEIQSQK